MNRYDPEVPPEPSAWLKLDEGERIQLCEHFHRAARIKLPSVRAHSALHAIVENQIAEGLEPVVRAVSRLMHEGLSRHEALHAISTAVAEHFMEAANSTDPDFGNTAQARYNAAVERITVTSWHEQYGGG